MLVVSKVGDIDMSGILTISRGEGLSKAATVQIKTAYSLEKYLFGNEVPEGLSDVVVFEADMPLSLVVDIDYAGRLPSVFSACELIESSFKSACSEGSTAVFCLLNTMEHSNELQAFKRCGFSELGREGNFVCMMRSC